MENKKYLVYKHTNKINGKIYIGITSSSINERAGSKGHKYKGCRHFKSAIDKYGYDNFEHEILFENLTKEEAEAKEIELIKFYDSNNREKGYNITSGGSVCEMTEESKKLISEKAKKRLKEKGTWIKGKKMKDIKPGYKNWNEGKKMKDIKPGWVNPLIGRHLSEETKRKISKANKGKPAYNKGVPMSPEHYEKCKPTMFKKGHVHSEETKRKRSKTWTEKWADHEYKAKRMANWKSVPYEKRYKVAIRCIELNREFSSCVEAIEELGICDRNLSDALAGRINTCGGYHWEYVDDEKRAKAHETALKRIKECMKRKGYRPLRCVETNEVFHSPAEAHKITGASTTQLRRILSGKPYTAKGLHWEEISIDDYISIVGEEVLYKF